MAKAMVQNFLSLSLLVLVLIGMTQFAGAQIETELKCSADKFFNMFSQNMMQMTTVLPHYFKSVKIIKGDGKSLGTIRQWQYVTPEAPSKMLTLKETVKSVDEENRSITLSVLSGDLMTHYKSFDVTLVATPKDVDNIEKSGTKVKCWIQYEKRFENVPSPDAHIHLVTAVTKELGHYLQQ